MGEQKERDPVGAPRRVLLCQLDGKSPNIALMRIAKWHRDRGDEVILKHGAAFEVGLFDKEPDQVYASVIFRKSIPLAERLKKRFPQAVLGGTGVDPARKGEVVPLSPVIANKITALEDHGFPAGDTAADMDYSLYPNFRQSIGFTQRGCRLRCSFCVVPYKEGAIRAVSSVWDIWRGNTSVFGPQWPRELLLLDNDFFGQPNWQDRIREIRDGGFKVSFNQGINARFLTDEAAEAIASVDYRDDSMAVKRIYSAWDAKKDEHRLFEGLRRLVKYGVKPDHVMVYCLCGFWPGETIQDRVYRIEKLLDFGARPYPMPFVRTPELVGLQRWALGAYAKRIPWKEWAEANFRPENLRKPEPTAPLFEDVA